VHYIRSLETLGSVPWGSCSDSCPSTVRTLGMKCRSRIVVVEAISGIPEESVCGGFDSGLGGLPSRNRGCVVQRVGQEDVLREETV